MFSSLFVNVALAHFHLIQRHKVCLASGRDPQGLNEPSMSPVTSVSGTDDVARRIFLSKKLSRQSHEMSGESKT